MKLTRFHINAINSAVLGEKSLEIILTSIILKIPDENRPHRTSVETLNYENYQQN